MLGRRKTDVLVVGAGPVGLCTALALADRGVRVRVIDGEWRPAAHSYSLALHPGSLTLLERLGVLGGVLDLARRVERVGFYDRTGRKASVELTGLGNHPFVAVLPQDRLERLLEEALGKRGVEVEWDHRAAAFEQDGERVRVRIDRLIKESVGYSVSHVERVVASSRETEVPFVVGADGHRSLVRRALGLELPEVGTPQHFALFELATDADLDAELRVVLEESHTDVLWPLSDGWCRWSFELRHSEVPEPTREKGRLAVQVGADRFPVLDPGRLDELLAARAPWFSGSIDEIRWRMAVRFERRLASAFGRGRVWLAGDAAHLTYPVGAQSMNIGLREGAELAGLLASILEGDEPLDRLDLYGGERLVEWRRLIALDESLRSTSAADPWLAGHAERLPACLPASGADLDRLLARLGFTAAEG